MVCMVACMDAGNSEAPVVTLYVLSHKGVSLRVGSGGGVQLWWLWWGVESSVLFSVCLCARVYAVPPRGWMCIHPPVVEKAWKDFGVATVPGWPEKVT